MQNPGYLITVAVEKRYEYALKHEFIKLLRPCK